MKKSILSSMVLLFALASMSQSGGQDGIAGYIRQGQESFEKSNFPDAGAAYEKALDISVQTGDTLSIAYAEALNGLAKISSKKGQLAAADSLFSLSLQIRKISAGEHSAEYAVTLNDWSKMLIEKQELVPAEKMLLQAVIIREKKYGKASIPYAESLNLLGYCYAVEGKKEEARKMLAEAADIRLKIAGERTPAYANSLLLLGNFSLFTENYAAALGYYTKAVEINKETLGAFHSEYIVSLMALSALTGAFGKYRESIRMILEALPVIEKNIGKANPDYTASLINLGSMYYAVGEYGKAEFAIQEAIPLSVQVFGKKHSYYFKAINTLGLCYEYLGYYEKAEPLLMESLKLRRESYGDSHPLVLNALNSMVCFYNSMGNYDEAIRLANEVIPLIKNTTGEQNSTYAILLSNIALAYERKGDWESALSLCEEASPILLSVLGENHPFYIALQGNIAVLKESDPNISEETIEKMYLDILRKKKELLGETHSDYFSTLLSLSSFYDLKGKHDKARELQMQALVTLKNVPDENPMHFKVLYAIGTGLEAEGAYEKASVSYHKAFDFLKKQTSQNLAFLSEKERELLWINNRRYLLRFKSFSAGYKDKDPVVSALAYDCELFSKSLLLNSSRQIQRSILESGNTETISQWQNIHTQRETIARWEAEKTKSLGLYSVAQLPDYIPISGDETLIKTWGNMQVLKKDLNQKEKELLVNSRPYRKQERDLKYGWKDIQQALDKDEAAIELITFTRSYPDTSRVMETVYAALLLRSGDEYPRMLTLCTEQELEEVIRRYALDSKQLYSLLWKPLESFLHDIHRIYIAPSGQLHTVSFAGLKKKHYLYETYEIHNLLSTKDIIALKEKEKVAAQEKIAVLFGGADYGLPYAELLLKDAGISSVVTPYQTRGLLDHADQTRGQGFDYLPGSRKEVEQISEKLSAWQWKTELYVGEEATESRFKSVVSNNIPGLIHISTHGFYYSPLPQRQSESTLSVSIPSDRNIYRISENPLMRCGLLFSGANHAWSGKELKDGTDDGILTAYEVSGLNLSRTDLLVLSSCDTGLGDVDSEGVYGLQRAFRLAGVQSMIVSLWKVPDQETVEWMDTFYTEWVRGSSAKAALTKAQQQIQKKYPGHPEKWAGFVLIE